MSDTPPLPPGFQLENRGDFDPVKPLLDAGVEITNGYRTPADIQRLKAEGYTPAEHSSHLNGDSVDLAPGKSGMSLAQLQAFAQQKFGPEAQVGIHNGTHVHVTLKGWGQAPGTPGTKYSGLPDLPPGFELQQRGALSSQQLTATGQAHDADTIDLSSGQHGRLFGFDAFELDQQGRNAAGEAVPLGKQARDYMLSRIAPGAAVNPTGDQSYGRPIVNMSADPMNDPAHDALRLGYGMAEPQYLKDSPQFGPYMEAERLARLNQLGGFQTNAETPSQYRHKSGPWQGTTPGVYGQPGSVATFFDDPSPFEGLRPEIAKAYNEFSRTAKTPEELVEFGKRNGFEVPLAEAKKFLQARDKGAPVSEGVDYIHPPRPAIDPGDGTFGSLARGIGDPFNALDEMGAVPDTLGLTPGRINIFNAPAGTRFGDIFASNLDQNRAILEHDEEAHPYARLTGQLITGVALPVGVASTPVKLAAIGAAEGGVAGFMGGEGRFTQRIPSAAAGAVGGAALGGTLGLVGEHVVAPASRKLFGRDVSTEIVPVEEAAAEAPRSAAMAADRPSEIVGPATNAADLPPMPEGFQLEEAPFGKTRPTSERLSAEETAKLAEGVTPESVLPHPESAVTTMEEADKAHPGQFQELQAPDEKQSLGVRTITTATGGKVKVRGPLDLTQSIRVMGGVKDDGGNLAHAGITNEPRRMPFGSNEQFLGKLINNDSGVSLDDAAQALWEEGYFPEFRERPAGDDLIDRLRAESTGAQRYFHPDDLGEVADFHAAQAERGRIEQAQDEGRPLVEERGDTINLDDLIANTPPASVYEDAPRITGKIGNVNLAKLENPGQISSLIDHISNRVGGFEAAARGRVTNEETTRLAQEMGLKPEDILKRRQGQALNAEQLYAMRATVQASRERVVRLARAAVGGSEDDLLAFRKAWLFHAALEEQVSGATAEAGRALQQFKMLARAGDAKGEAVRNYLRGGGGRDGIEDAAQKIVDLSEDPAQANRFIADSVKPRWRDKLNELWVNSLLSGLRTHAVNFVGNTMMTVASFPELATTAAIGKLTRSADRALFGEVGARAAGLADSSMDALRAMKTAFKTGEPVDESAKVEAIHHQAIGGKLGTVIRTPTRALTAADEFWKSLLSHAELHQLAYRIAKNSTHDPEAFKAKYAELVAHPTEEMMGRARASARYWTFQKPLGPVGRAVQQISNNWVLGKLLLPFVRTPSNIIKFAGERSALAPLMPEVREALKAGGRARDEALARITLGSGLSTAAVAAALSGRMSGGGPTDPRELAALRQSGWQPYSIKIGNRWVSYSRLDPAATLLGVAADLAEAGQWGSKRELDQIALKLTESIAKNITSKTWLSGLSDAFDVLSDPERYGKHYVQRLAASMAVPAIASQTAQTLDPNLHDARTIMDAIKARIPVVSKSVPVRRNVWGDPIKAGDSVGPNIVSPFYASAVSKDPLNREIARLQAPLSMPQRSVMVAGKRVPLTPSQYDEYVQLSGKAAKSYLEQFITTPEWKAMTDDERRDEVKGALEDFRGAARDELRTNYPELNGDGGASPQAGGDAALPPLPPGFQLAR